MSCSLTKRYFASEIKPGVKIYYPHWAGYEIEVDEVKYLLVREHDILAYVDSDD
jgi:co-chaperonin GroES (HSP10)